MDQHLELTPAQLRAVVPPESIPFNTTAELATSRGTFGQERAMAALNFGCGMDQPGYNVFASGPTGSGRNSAVLARVKEIAAGRRAPSDWCYVYNFDDPRRPTVLRLPAGTASAFADDVSDLIGLVRRELPRSFESDTYETLKESTVGDVQTERNRILRDLELEARADGLMLQPTPMGVVTLPVAEGRPMSREQFDQLPEEDRHQLEERMEKIRERIGEALTQARELEKEAKRRVDDLDRQHAMSTIGEPFAELRQKYAANEAVARYLDRMAEDIVEHQEEFRCGGARGGEEGASLPLPRQCARLPRG